MENGLEAEPCRAGEDFWRFLGFVPLCHGNPVTKKGEPSESEGETRWVNRSVVILGLLSVSRAHFVVEAETFEFIGSIVVSSALALRMVLTWTLGHHLLSSVTQGKWVLGISIPYL